MVMNLHFLLLFLFTSSNELPIVYLIFEICNRILLLQSIVDTYLFISKFAFLPKQIFRLWMGNGFRERNIHYLDGLLKEMVFFCVIL